jgi:hypothetical protein
LGDRPAPAFAASFAASMRGPDDLPKANCELGGAA